jgi:HEAT repeat protein
MSFIKQRKLFRLTPVMISFMISSLASASRLEVAQASSQNVTQGCLEEEVRQYVDLFRDSDMREIAGTEMAESCGSSAVLSLGKFLQKEKDQAVREQIVIVLDKVGGEKAINILIRTFSTDSDLKIRKISAQKLGHLRAVLAIKPLVIVLENLKEKSEVRQSAASALGDISTPTVVTPLVSSMRNIKNPLELRKSAAKALVKTKDLTIDSLVPILQDPNAGLQVQYWVIKNLVQIDSLKSNQVLTSNKSKVIKILDSALKPPNDIVEIDRGLGRLFLCQWGWARRNVPQCK